LRILGLNAFHGDSSVALVSDGTLVNAIEEERLNRIKHWAGLPLESSLRCQSDGCPDHIAISRDPRANIARKLIRAASSPGRWAGAFDRAKNSVQVSGVGRAFREAALPRALENMERFGVPKHIVALVLPAGYSFNLDGSTLYLSLASVFVAQAAGVDLPIGTQLMMMLTLMLTSKGVAGVPRASLVILAGTLASFNLPLEGIAIILGVDELMDMARTSVNLLGNCLATAVVARWEGVDLSTPPPPMPEPVEEAVTTARA
jgi:hypothetical protein